MKVRPARPGDGPALATIYAPVVRETGISFELEPPDGEAMAERIRKTVPTHPWLVAEDGDGRVAGYAYATPFRTRPGYRWTCEVSVYVDAAFRGAGLGGRLYAALLAVVEHLGYRTALAGVALPNPASVRLHEAAGFRRVGVFREVGHKLGEWRDVEWWERPLADPGPDPAPPARFEDVAGRAETELLMAPREGPWKVGDGGGGSVRVRPAEPDDREAWLAMRCALYPGSREEHEEDLDRYFAGVPDEVALLAVADTGAAAGFAELRLRGYAEGCTTSPVGYLEGIWVEPAHRRAGVGLALVAAGESWARERGCTEMASDAATGNAASRSFHRAAGFSEVEEVVCFRKGLSAPAAGG